MHQLIKRFGHRYYRAQELAKDFEALKPLLQRRTACQGFYSRKVHDFISFLLFNYFKLQSLPKSVGRCRRIKPVFYSSTMGNHSASAGRGGIGPVQTSEWFCQPLLPPSVQVRPVFLPPSCATLFLCRQPSIAGLFLQS
jgi:hypothetical protein